MFDFLEDLGLDNLRCSLCSATALVASSSSSNTENRIQHHLSCPNHPNNRPTADADETQTKYIDCPPPYESPPSYEELRAESLLIDLKVMEQDRTPHFDRLILVNRSNSAPEQQEIDNQLDNVVVVQSEEETENGRSLKSVCDESV